MDFVNGTAVGGVVVVLVSAAAAAICVLVFRRLDVQDDLAGNAALVNNVYPIIGLVYGVFLGFTIVITWGHFQEAEVSVMEEVTHLSALWRDSEPFREPTRSDIHTRLSEYVRRVIDSEWKSMADTGEPDKETEDAYEKVWDAFYTFEPAGAIEAAFMQKALDELNDLGRARRQRVHYASAQVQSLVRLFLIGGGIITVLFSLLIPAGNVRFHVLITMVIAALIAFSIFLALSLQRPFSGDVAVTPEAFENLRDSFAKRQERTRRALDRGQELKSGQPAVTTDPGARR